MTTGSKLPASTYLPLWLDALAQEIGIYIECEQETKTLLVNALYEARKQANDPALDQLMIIQPADGVVYIAKKTVSLDN